jgi:GH35 family endo-1,4-beta-xylanase/peptidoglycan/xylan/chitin deacetylase (PgdA/CDA1 family)
VVLEFEKFMMNKHLTLSALTVGVVLSGGMVWAQTGAPKPMDSVRLVNPGFEDEKAGWTIQERTPMTTMVAEAARTGKFGLRVNDEDEKLGSSAWSAPIAVTARQGYELTFWAKSPQGSAAGVYLSFTGQDGKSISEYQPATILRKSEEWKKYRLLVRAPETATAMKVWIHSFGQAKMNFDLDDLQLVKASGPEVDGLPVPVPATASLEARTRKTPPYIILKLDDMASAGTRVPVQWKKLAEFTRGRNIKASIGIICKSLEGDKPEYLGWIKEQHATGLFEFWNHGYEHKEFEFMGASYEDQKQRMDRCEELARTKLGFSLRTFGPPYGNTDDVTSRVLSESKDLKIWLYGDAQNLGGKIDLNRIGEVNIESPLFSPSLEKFKAGYEKYPDRNYFVIQGHPPQWDDARFEQFYKIIDFLVGEKAVFVTPEEYVKVAGLTPIKEPGVSKNSPVVVKTAALIPVAARQMAGARQIVGTPQDLIANGDFEAPLADGWTVNGKTVTAPQVVEAKIEGAPVKRAVQVELAAAVGAQPWDVRLVAAKTPQTVAKGDMVLVQFWAKSSQKTRILAVFQQATEPYEKTLRQTASLNPQWQKFTFYAPAKTNYGPGGSNFELMLGQATGKLDIAGVSVQNVGQMNVAEAKERFGAETVDYYGGEEHDDRWIPAAEARIEKIRKADLKIRVVDANGKPVPGAKVVLTQKKAAFRWGTAVNYRLLEEGADGDKYRAEVKRLFNTAVLENELKWKATDGKPEALQRAAAMLDWLKANGFAVRGHTLVWGNDRYLPDRIKGLSADAARDAVHKRVDDAVSMTKGKVYVWDAVNEAGLNVELWDKIGWNEFAGVYKRAKAIDPQLLLAYNDYNISNEAPDRGTLRRKVEARIQTLLDAGAPLDILGDQAHIGIPLTTIPRALEIWNEWGKKYGKPIEITEFDANIEDDQVHAKYVRDYLIGAFSNPNIESFLMWGFWEKAHWLGATGAMFRADWTPRPAQLAYEELVLKKWRTNLSLTTDRAGTVATRGFLGDYDLQVTAAGKKTTVPISLGKGGWQKDVVLP